MISIKDYTIRGATKVVQINSNFISCIVPDGENWKTITMSTGEKFRVYSEEWNSAYTINSHKTYCPPGRTPK